MIVTTAHLADKWFRTDPGKRVDVPATGSDIADPPFGDNTQEAITAHTMRQFAWEIYLALADAQNGATGATGADGASVDAGFVYANGATPPSWLDWTIVPGGDPGAENGHLYILKTASDGTKSIIDGGDVTGDDGAPGSPPDMVDPGGNAAGQTVHTTLDPRGEHVAGIMVVPSGTVGPDGSSANPDGLPHIWTTSTYPSTGQPTWKDGGAVGSQGPQGDPGTSIVSLNISDGTTPINGQTFPSGRLIIVTQDASGAQLATDAGVATGPPGVAGVPGVDGHSVMAGPGDPNQAGMLPAGATPNPGDVWVDSATGDLYILDHGNVWNSAWQHRRPAGQRRTRPGVRYAHRHARSRRSGHGPGAALRPSVRLALAPRLRR